MATIAIRALAIARCGVGIALLALPQTTARLCLMPASAPATLIYRLAGSRDFAVGGLLWSASATAPQPSSTAIEPPPSAASAKTSNPRLRQALIAGAIVDAIDLISVGASFADGSLPLEPAALVGAGAVLFLTLGLVGLRSSGLGLGYSGYSQIK